MSDFFALLARLQDWRNLLDVALVSLVVYGVLHLFRGTQALQVLRGLVLVALVVAVANQVIELTAFKWLLATAAPLLLVAVPVIFQPELRRALEQVGRTTPLLRRRNDNAASQRVINEVVKTVDSLVQQKHGALMVFEDITGLGEITSRGVPLDAEITADLLTTIFFPNTSLHDGAVVIQGNRIVAASCILPLTQRETGDQPHMGTRHRAALGVTEQTDALAVVVSEETGAVSVARNGRIVKVDTHRLRSVLSELYKPGGSEKL